MNKLKVLLTSTSFQDTPGRHHDLLAQQDWTVDRLRGPLNKEQMLAVIDQYDALICGDDHLDEDVLQKGYDSKLRFISKYGVGLDKIDLNHAQSLGIPVTNCPGVNQISVAEHVIGLVLTFQKNIHLHYANTSQNRWERFTGSEIFGKTFGVLGLGSIGKEVAIRAKALGCKVVAYDPYENSNFANANGVTLYDSPKTLVENSNILSIHIPLTAETERLFDEDLLGAFSENALLINTARGGIVDNKAVLSALNSGKLKGYLCDVLEDEPMTKNHPFSGRKDIIITPHVGSRTVESVERQGSMAVENLIKMNLKNN